MEGVTQALEHQAEQVENSWRYELRNKKFVAYLRIVRRLEQVLNNDIQQWNPSTFFFNNSVIRTQATKKLTDNIACVPLDGHNHCHEEGPNLDSHSAGSRELPGKALSEKGPKGSIVIPVVPQAGAHCKIPNL